MMKVTRGEEVIGHIERFRGNKPKEQWMAFRPRLAGDNETYPSRKKGFTTRRAAVDWLDAPEENAPRT